MDTVNLLGKPYLQLLIQTPFLSCLCWLIDNCRTSLTAHLVNMSKMIYCDITIFQKKTLCPTVTHNHDNIRQ